MFYVAVLVYLFIFCFVFAWLTEYFRACHTCRVERHFPRSPFKFGKHRLSSHWLTAIFHRSSKAFFCLFDLIPYVPVNNFSVMSDGSSWVEPVLSKDQCVLLKNTTQWRQWVSNQQPFSLESALYHWATALRQRLRERERALSSDRAHFSNPG